MAADHRSQPLIATPAFDHIARVILTMKTMLGHRSRQLKVPWPDAYSSTKQ
jgi:hypothetical protein